MPAGYILYKAKMEVFFNKIQTKKHLNFDKIQTKKMGIRYIFKPLGRA
jgi:hypothetical protein